MKISAALSQARLALDSKGVSNSGLDSLILLSHTLFLCGENFSKEWVIFNPDFELSFDQQKIFLSLVSRREGREPISQIIGKREFFGEDFLVSKNVLDPRPDSESLIELILKIFPEKNKKLKILELGVGSGCLIVTLLRLYGEANGTGIDISDDALEICKKNSEKQLVSDRLKLLKSDLFEILKQVQDDGCEGWDSDFKGWKKYDLIISNPPYIPSKEIEDLEPEVRVHEPRIALDGGGDGLNFYRKIAASAENFLNKNGKIILEIGFGQKEEIVKIFSENKFKLTDSKPDLAGVDRALCFEF